MALLVQMALPVQLDLKALRAFREFLVQMVPLVPLVLMVLLVLMVSKAFRVFRAYRAFKVKLDPKVHRALPEMMALMVLPEQLGLPVLMAVTRTWYGVA
jgi:hypothetical protein